MSKSDEALGVIHSLQAVAKNTPEIAQLIADELKKQRHCLKLIASENYSSIPVQLAMGNWLTDKYAEGSPHKRCYAGCEQVDAIEMHAQGLAQELFNMPYAFVQPYSGADANMIAYWAILTHTIQKPFLEKLGKRLHALSPEELEQMRKCMNSQTLMGMSLQSGGHLTHGYCMNVSARMFRAVQYNVDQETEQLNYQKIRQQAHKERPLILVAGFSAYSQKIDFSIMKEIADEVGAVLLVDMAHISGIVAAGAYTDQYDPTRYADIITSTTHKTLRGPRGGLILARAEYASVLNQSCPISMGGPGPHIVAAKAVAFKEAKRPAFRHYIENVLSNAKILASELQKQGVRIVSGGTENHIVIADIRKFGINGHQAEQALADLGILCNRNTIPFDPNPPLKPSGLRFGVAALTSLGMGAEEMCLIAEMITRALKSIEVNDTTQQSTVASHIASRIRRLVEEMVQKFPLYPDITLPEQLS